MTLKILLTVPFLLVTLWGLGQNNVRKMGSPLNHPSLNYWSPFISLDGQSLLFQCDNTENRIPQLFFTTRIGTEWKDPIQLPKNINSTLAFQSGATLSPDGNEIWVPAQRSGGIGGYDLIAYTVKPDGFSEGKNPGTPLNSKEHEASAVFTSDGGTIYFMRCTIMNPNQAEGCRILTSKRKLNGAWEAPVDLPEIINAGNSQFPRILADGETLIFLTDKHQPGLGGLDYFMSRFDGETWSTPIPLAFLNSDKNEQPISLNSFGRSVYTALPGIKRYELSEVIFPLDLKPRSVLKVLGNITGMLDPSAAYLSVYDSASGKLLRSIRPDRTGGFTIYLAYGNSYRLFADPAEDKLTFFSKVYNLQSGQGQVIEKLSVQMGTLESDYKLDLGHLSFLENTAPTPGSVPMLNRIIRLMQSNSKSSFQIQCDDADGYDLIFRHLRKKGVINELEFIAPEIPSGKTSIFLKG